MKYLLIQIKKKLYIRDGGEGGEREKERGVRNKPSNSSGRKLLETKKE